MNEDLPFFYPDCLSLINDVYRRYDHFNFIDVGCYNGGWINIFRALAMGKPMFTIAIDPVRQTLADNPGLGHEPILYEYDVFLEKAVSQQPGKRPFYRYKQSEQNGSLRMINKDGITFDEKDRSEKFFINQEILGSMGVPYSSLEEFSEMKEIREVECVTLESVCDDYLSGKEEVIHFLKIDTQGTDIEAFLSLGKKYIVEKCIFAQLECTMSKSEKAQMYEGASIFVQDVEIMKDHGFEIANIRNYHKLTSEADVVFFNKRFK